MRQYRPMRIAMFEVAADIPQEKVDRVVNVLRATLAENGKFAVLRLPDDYPDELMPGLLSSVRATADQLLKQQNEQGAAA